MTDFNFEPLETEGQSSERKDPAYGFVMCHVADIYRCGELLKEKVLKPRDLAVLVILVGYHNARSGLCHVSLTHLAESMGARLTDVSSCMSRLKKALLVATYVDKKTGQRSYLLNPHVFSAGGKSKRVMLWKTFMTLVNE
jgi:hypothetical protein